MTPEKLQILDDKLNVIVLVLLVITLMFILISSTLKK